MKTINWSQTINQNSIEPNSIDVSDLESMFLHKNTHDCDYNGRYWTEWSDNETANDCYNSSIPIFLDMRQKENKYHWKVSGNILLHRQGRQWRYGLPYNTKNEVYCFNELQEEAFPMNIVNCIKMEKRVCCEPKTVANCRPISRKRKEGNFERNSHDRILTVKLQISVYYIIPNIIF